MEVLGKVLCERCGSDTEVMDCLDNNVRCFWCKDCIKAIEELEQKEELEQEKDERVVPFSIFLADFKVSRR